MIQKGDDHSHGRGYIMRSGASAWSASSKHDVVRLVFLLLFGRVHHSTWNSKVIENEEVVPRVCDFQDAHPDE